MSLVYVKHETDGTKWARLMFIYGSAPPISFMDATPHPNAPSKSALLLSNHSLAKVVKAEREEKEEKLQQQRKHRNRVPPRLVFR